jgi:tyrosine-protein kinase Etk/Wzc
MIRRALARSSGHNGKYLVIEKVEVANQSMEQAVMASPASGSSQFTWHRLVTKRWRLIAILAISIIGVALAAVLLLPSRYTATVVILPPQQAGSGGAAMMAQMGSMGGVMASAAGGLSIKNPNDQQISLLKSRVVEDAMVARFHLQRLYHKRYLSSARKRWESATEADNGLKDGLIRLSVADRDPHRAEEMANGWVEEYRSFTATLAVTEASQRRLFYERQLNSAREDLNQAEEQMKQTEQRTGLIDLEGQNRSMIASAAVLRGQLAAKQIEIKGMLEFAAEGNPDLLRAQQEASGMEAQLAKMDAASDRKTGDLVAPKGEVTQASLEYGRAMREVKYRETIQDLLTRQYEGARVDEARQGALVQIVDPAVDPDRPDLAYKIWILVSGLILSLPVGLVAAILAEASAALRAKRELAGSWSKTLEGIFAEHEIVS